MYSTRQSRSPQAYLRTSRSPNPNDIIDGTPAPQNVQRSSQVDNSTRPNPITQNMYVGPYRGTYYKEYLNKRLPQRQNNMNQGKPVMSPCGAITPRALICDLTKLEDWSNYKLDPCSLVPQYDQTDLFYGISNQNLIDAERHFREFKEFRDSVSPKNNYPSNNNTARSPSRA